MTSHAELAPPAPDELLVVVGPTGTGKSDLALALAERFDAEIVGADSVQVYTRFDLGSGKPTADERARVPHHLVDAVDPMTHLDAAGFVVRADAAIDDARRRGKAVIVCGGTFLWVKALLSGLAPLPPADPVLRAEHQRRVAEHGRAALHADLAKVDPEAAARLAPNDTVRVSRALEVFELSGRPQSAWHAEHGFAGERHRARLLGVARSREELDHRIAMRTARWLAGGWVDEVRRLMDEGYGEARAMGSVGYRQVRDHLAGRLPEAALHEAIVRATRVYVRRQRTWLREQPVSWLAPPDG